MYQHRYNIFVYELIWFIFDMAVYMYYDPMTLIDMWYLYESLIEVIYICIALVILIIIKTIFEDIINRYKIW